MKVDWNQFKQVLNAKSLSPQCIEKPNYYVLTMIDGPYELNCEIDKDPSDDSELVDFVTNYLSKCNGIVSQQSSPFSAKKIGTKNLFKRVHGISAQATVGDVILEFINPYLLCKITGVEVVGASNGDSCDFEVWYGNVKLNQFGFNVFLAKDFYSHHSEYDSDIPQGIKIKVIYHSVSEKMVGINLILNELK